MMVSGWLRRADATPPECSTVRHARCRGRDQDRPSPLQTGRIEARARFEDASHGLAICKHIIVPVLPLARWAGELGALQDELQSRSRTASRLRCSSVRPKSFTASASAVFASGASMVPRLWARDRRIVTRQRRSVSLGGLHANRKGHPGAMAGWPFG
jgi:hypothetical protein